MENSREEQLRKIEELKALAKKRESKKVCDNGHGKSTKIKKNDSQK